MNVASFCGLTPQYEGLEKLYERFGAQGFAVIGIPCNQFGAQEPGTADEIKTFCSTNYNVTFPLSEKIEVNGDGRHPLYQQLTPKADAEGHTGDIRWNFEKFLVGRDGEVIAALLADGRARERRHRRRHRKSPRQLAPDAR